MEPLHVGVNIDMTGPPEGHHEEDLSPQDKAFLDWIVFHIARDVVAHFLALERWVSGVKTCGLKTRTVELPIWHLISEHEVGSKEEVHLSTWRIGAYLVEGRILNVLNSVGFL